MRPEYLLLAAPLVLFSMVAHEYAHGYAALKQGDPTAYQLGRLTWNPLKHIDPFMTVIVPIMTFYFAGFIFGGAKPVPVVPRNYRNYKRGDIIVSLAGIATNLVLAIVCTIAIILVGVIGRSVAPLTETCAIFQVMLSFGIYINVLLAWFNLLPIPPLDGSHVMKYLLPPAWALQYQALGRFGFLIIIALFALGGSIFGALLTPVFAMMGFAMRVSFPYLIPSTAIANPFLGFG